MCDSVKKMANTNMLPMASATTRNNLLQFYHSLLIV